MSTKYVILKTSNRYVALDHIFQSGIPVEVSAKLARHLLRQRNGRGVKFFKSISEEAAERILDRLSAIEEEDFEDEVLDDDEMEDDDFEDDDEDDEADIEEVDAEDSTPPATTKAKKRAAKKKPTAKKTVRKVVRKKKKASSQTVDV